MEILIINEKYKYYLSKTFIKKRHQVSCPSRSCIKCAYFSNICDEYFAIKQM